MVYLYIKGYWRLMAEVPTVRFRTVGLRERTVQRPKTVVGTVTLSLIFNNLRIEMILAPLVHTLLVQWI
jgi:hypothetical protein